MTERDWPYLDRVKAMNDDLRASIAEQKARADAAEAERAGLSRHLMDSQAEVERLRAGQRSTWLAEQAVCDERDSLRAAVTRVRALCDAAEYECTNGGADCHCLAVSDVLRAIGAES